MKGCGKRHSLYTVVFGVLTLATSVANGALIDMKAMESPIVTLFAVLATGTLRVLCLYNMYKDMKENSYLLDFF